MANKTVKFSVGGPVQAKAGTYLSRPADDELFEACQAGEFSYVLACRQIGKSSLMFETASRLRQDGVETATIDLNKIGQAKDAESWYISLLDVLARELNLEIDVQSWWDERSRLTPVRHFLQFLRDVVLKEISQPIVIFIDEIDMTLGLSFTDDFFAAIRAFYNDRVRYQAYHRLTFVLLGVATPDELIQDNNRTPFNIGRPISLRDFTQAECDPFRLEIEAQFPSHESSYFEQIYSWTSGHPYLTQKLCEAVLKQPHHQDAPDLVETVVQQLFLTTEDRSDDNIQVVQSRVKNDQFARKMLLTYQEILEGKTVLEDERSVAQNRLKLYGLVVAKDGKLEVRNKLYRHVFDASWAEKILKTLSPPIPSKYKILQEIGQGGFATVYLAQIEEADKTQSVALKVLKAHTIGDKNLLKRFKQEAVTVTKLAHPNIVQILEAEVGGDEEIFYIVMEYIPGGTLRDRLKSGPLPRSEAIHIANAVGSALQYAHQEGIIHRDVNPNNILLDDRQQPVRPVLSDFGLIKVLSGESSTQIQSTTILGTPDYMAPEQLGQEAPTAATDVYALAITCFEMLSGQRPFQLNSPFELINKNLPQLSAVAPEVGPYFDEVLARAADKNPAQRFPTIAAFLEALGEANRQAAEVERVEREYQAGTIIDAAQSYIQKGRYAPERALAMVEAALETYPGYRDALRLRGKIRLQQGQVEEAMADYWQAYQQVNNPASDIGVEYLTALDQVAAEFWQRELQPEAIEYYSCIIQLLTDAGDGAEALEDILQRARTHLIKFHYDEGNAAFAEGAPEDIEAAITILQDKVNHLVELKAENECAELREKLRLLRKRKYEADIEMAQGAINEINAQGSQIRFSSEDIFQHYALIDAAYQGLLDLDPEHKQWVQGRRKKLREQVECRLLFAVRATGKFEPDYEAALRYYRSVLDIEKKHPGIVKELETTLDLNEKINELQTKADFDGKYREIRKLIDQQDYDRALQGLDKEFIQTGNYEHRDVAKWLWGLVYAKHHDGKLPLEWDSLAGFDSLSKYLMQTGRSCIQRMRSQLEPWSQPRILETIARENKLLTDYEGQVKDIESLLAQAVSHGIARAVDIEKCDNELAGVKRQIQTQRDFFFQIDVNEKAQKVEEWLQKIEDIEALLSTSNPVKNIPEFLNQIDIEQQAIEKDPMLDSLQAAVSANVHIGETINQLKLRIKRRLVEILIGDVGQRDETIVELKSEVQHSRAELAQAQAELAKTRAETSELQQSLTLLQQQLDKPHQQHEINKYLIPVLLMAALLAGGLIASQIETLPGLSILRWVALALLLACFIYYLWIYYLASPRSRD